MKVSELISLLSTFHPDEIVMIPKVDSSDAAHVSEVLPAYSFKEDHGDGFGMIDSLSCNDPREAPEYQDTFEDGSPVWSGPVVPVVWIV